ncbi:MAG TPA: hypothetical protein PKK06_05310 [Phycisphaerae bacterium]|nr:hypothetical protein [Phycisphaerae bacterium]HNU44825.1 hypothetical protein [Phycisphaerae bacterium]
MAGELHKVRRGDPLKIAASTFNTFIDAARDFQARQHNRASGSQREQRQTGIIPVRNDSGAVLDRFAVLGLAGPLIDPTDNLEEFQNRVAMSGVVPADGHRGRFVVLLEPAAAGDIVRACVSGACVVRVEMQSNDDDYADIEPDETRWLLSGGAGLAQLLWVQPEEQRDDPDVAWAVARLGGGASTGLEFVIVREVHETWLIVQQVAATEGGFEITGDAFLAWPWPMVRTVYYSPFIVEGELQDWVTVMPLARIGGRPYVMQLPKFAAIGPVPNYPVVDGIPAPGV